MTGNRVKLAAPGKIEALGNQLLTDLTTKPNSHWQAKLGRCVED